MAAAGMAVDLDTLNAKALAKEFKAAGKGVKSKDPLVKGEALAKLNNVRYYTEGGVLLPLVEQAVPKKVRWCTNGRCRAVLEVAANPDHRLVVDTYLTPFLPTAPQRPPPQKTLDNTKMTLDVLLSFLGAPVFSKSPVADHVHAALRVVCEALGGHLATLKILVDMLVFKEDIKLPKPKKGQPVVIPPENEEPIYIRKHALKVLCSVAAALSAPNTVDAEICKAFANIPAFADTLCVLLESFLAPRFASPDEHEREHVLQEAGWALLTLVFVLQHNRDVALPALLASNVLPVLATLSSEPSLSTLCLQVYETVALHASTLDGVLEEAAVTTVVDVVVKAADALHAHAEAANADAGGKGGGKAAPAKPAGKGKGDVPAEGAEKAVPKGHTAPPHRLQLASVKLAATTLVAVCERNGRAVTAAAVAVLVPSLAKAMVNKTAWDIAQAPADEPFDLDLTDTFEKCSILFGAIGLVGTAPRRAACDAGALPLLMTVLQNSLPMFGMKPLLSTAAAPDAGAKGAPPAKGKPAPAAAAAAPVSALSPEEEAERTPRMQRLRRVTEQSLLRLLTVARPRAEPFVEGVCGQRWASARARYVTDVDLFGIVTEVPEPLEVDPDGDAAAAAAPAAAEPRGMLFPTAQALEMIANDADLDLGTRAFRVVSAVLGGVDDPTSFVAVLAIDTAAAVGAVSAAVQARLVAVYEAFEAAQAAQRAKEEQEKAAALAAAEAAALAAGDADGVPESKQEDEGAAAAEPGAAAEDAAAADVAAPVPAPDLLLPTATEGLYLAMNVAETLLPLSAANVNAFATRERLAAIAALLYRCGPTGTRDSSTTSTSTSISPSPSGAGDAHEETHVPLYDPRNFTWYPTPAERAHDDVLLRPLLFDALAAVAAAEDKYRSYEGGAAPDVSLLGAPPPVYTSVCKEAALTACRLCADACVAAVLVEARYTLFCAERAPLAAPTVAVHAAGPSPTLHRSVLDAALGALHAMAGCGTTGLLGVLESVAEMGFYVTGSGAPVLSGNAKNAAYASMAGLKRFLASVPAAELSPEGDEEAADKAKAALGAAHTWTRSQFFDQLFPGGEGEGYAATPSTLLATPQAWPYLTLAAALAGVVSGVHSARSTINLALAVTERAVRVAVVSDVSQPVVADALAAHFVSVGGAVAMVGALGRFGTARRRDASPPSVDAHERGVGTLKYLLGRGRDRGEYWLSKVPVEVPAEVGGKGKGKDAKKTAAKPADKKKPDKNAPPPGIVEDVEWNTETDAANPDPNHGPSRRLWKALLEVRADELHTCARGATALTTASVSGLPHVLAELVHEGAGINLADGAGVTPLMYALLFNDAASVAALVEASADVDALDASGAPALKYACLCMSSADVYRTFPGPLSAATVLGAHPTATVLGGCDLLNALLDAGADVQVCDASSNTPPPPGGEPNASPPGAGNPPLLWALGLAESSVVLGGYQVVLKNDAYQPRRPRDNTLAVARALLRAGAQVNACNARGVVPLHVAAARGHLAMVETFKDSRAVANPADAWGYLPGHYCAAACPADATAEPAAAVFDALIAYGTNRPVQRMRFADARTGRSKEEKYGHDVSARIGGVLDDALRGDTIRAVRLTEADLLQQAADDGLTVLHLCMCAHVLRLEAFCALPHALFSGGKAARTDLLIHLVRKCGADPMSTLAPPTLRLLSAVDSTGLTALHAAALLLEGSTPRRTLTAAELRSKRVKSYPSPELHLLDFVFTAAGNDVDGACTRPVLYPGLDMVPWWTPLHAAIAQNNPDLVRTLLTDKRASLMTAPYVHFLVCSDAEAEICDAVVAAAGAAYASAPWLLDAPSSAHPQWSARPLHLAVRRRNMDALRALVRFPRTNLNVADEDSGLTALHEAVVNADTDALAVFATVSDRLDLLLEGPASGKTCVETALDGRDAELVAALLRMRRNDVLERLLRQRDGSSLLAQLETENVAIATRLGYVPPPAEGDAEAAAGAEASAAEGAADGLAQQLQEVTLGASMQLPPPAPLTAYSPRIDNELAIIALAEADAPAPAPRWLDTPAVDDAELLRRSDAVLKVLLEAVNDTGLGDHVHECFAAGRVYREFCDSNIVKGRAMAFFEDVLNVTSRQITASTT